MTLHDKVDPHEVAHAKSLLLGTGGIPPERLIAAYRLLAAADSAAVYLPKLADALLDNGGHLHGAATPARLAVCTEAAAIARSLGPTSPANVRILERALGAYQHQLYLHGRRSEGFAVRAELARASAEAETAGWPGSAHAAELFATALAEEGRHSEAAEAYGRIVARERAADPEAETSFWHVVAWAAELAAAGAHDEAIEVFGGLVERKRRGVAAGDTSIAIAVWALVRLSQMLDARDRRDEARAAREEAVALTARLAEAGEPRDWSCLHGWWATLLAASGRADEVPAPGAPEPPLGLGCWSPDLRAAFFDGSRSLLAEITALAAGVGADPRGRLPELITAHRKLTIRLVMEQEPRTRDVGAAFLALFDAGVALARAYLAAGGDRARALLARALTDRSMLLIAGRRNYPAALADFREADALSA